jgi:hypothetical protein
MRSQVLAGAKIRRKALSMCAKAQCRIEDEEAYDGS